MPLRRLLELEPPGPLRYLIGAAIMMLGVVLPVGYMMFRNKRGPSTSSYSKQTIVSAGIGGLIRGITDASLKLHNWGLMGKQGQVALADEKLH